MDNKKYIGMDVHQATVSAGVLMEGAGLVPFAHSQLDARLRRNLSI